MQSFYQGLSSKNCSLNITTTGPCKPIIRQLKINNAWLLIIFYTKKGPSYNNKISLELISAPYTDKSPYVKMKMPTKIFNSFTLIDYFIVNVGNGIDCGNSLLNFIW